MTQQLEQWPLERLVPYARNPRKNDQAVDKVASAIREFGFRVPILAKSDGTVIDGHLRLKAAHKLKLETVPVLLADDMTETQVKAFRISVNRMSELAEWDIELLALELEDLRLEDFDIDLTGFDPGELKLLFDEDVKAETEGDTEPQIDRAGELQKQWGVETGQLWQLGGHRILCGDSTKAEDVGRVMQGEKADLCLTDPPYGIGETCSDKNKYYQYQDTKENLKSLIDAFLSIAHSISTIVVLTPSTLNHRMYPDPSWTMAWFYPAGAFCCPWGFSCWQPILCYGKDPKTAKCKGSHPDAIVLTESAEKLGHPCPKPIKFWQWLMERTSEKGEIIFEPFSGSGTTLIACENLGRKCRAIEISPGYVAVALQRWADHTGKTPVLTKNGGGFGA